MIRIPESEPPAKVKQAWEKAALPLYKEALAEFSTWPLYQHAGEPWTDAPARFVRVPSLKAVVKGLKSKETQTLNEAANPGLSSIYMNLAADLHIRSSHLSDLWDKQVGKPVLKATRPAFQALCKRLGEKATGEEGFFLYPPNSKLYARTWERLHADVVEAPFHELECHILRAGHIPAGLQGSDWKSCRFLYF